MLNNTIFNFVNFQAIPKRTASGVKTGISKVRPPVRTNSEKNTVTVNKQLKFSNNSNSKLPSPQVRADRTSIKRPSRTKE